jgi:hypothetical protein
MKTLHGMTEQELRDYIKRREFKLATRDFSEYGKDAETVKHCREYGLNKLKEEINNYFL